MGGEHKDCLAHQQIEGRVAKLEDAINEIRAELKAKAITDAKIQATLDLATKTLDAVQKDTRGLRDDLVKLVAETLEKTRNDMSTWVQMGATNEEKEREWQRRSDEADKRFYRKLIIGCVAILGTITLSYFGIKAIIPLIG